MFIKSHFLSITKVRKEVYQLLYFMLLDKYVAGEEQQFPANRIVFVVWEDSMFNIMR